MSNITRLSKRKKISKKHAWRKSIGYNPLTGSRPYRCYDDNSPKPVDGVPEQRKQCARSYAKYVNNGVGYV